MTIDITRVPAGLEFISREFGRMPPIVSITERSGRYQDRVLDQPWQPLRVRGDAYCFSFADARRIDEFFVSRSGQMFAFLFGNCYDDVSENALLGIGDASKTVFDLYRDYADPDAARTYKHPILYPDADTLSVTVDGVAAAFTYLGAGTGQVQMSSAPGAGLEVRASFRFDVPVRLSGAWPGWTHSVEGFRAPGLELIEVRD